MRKQIYEGVFKDGDLLPSEYELCATFKVTRSTVRKALDELAKDNLISKEKGRGSVVKREHKSLGLLGVKGFSQIVSGKNQRVTTSVIQAPKIQNWSDDFFYTISKEELDTQCVFIKRLRCVEDDIVMLENTFIPAFSNYNLDKLPITDFVNGSLFETLHLTFGITIQGVEEDLRAISASEDIAKHMQIDVGQPILNIYLKFNTNKKDLFIYSNMLCNTEKYTIGNLI